MQMVCLGFTIGAGAQDDTHGVSKKRNAGGGGGPGSAYPPVSRASKRGAEIKWSNPKYILTTAFANLHPHHSAQPAQDVASMGSGPREER